MTKNLNHVDDESLFIMVRKTKDGLIGYIDHGPEAAGQPFHLGLMMLEIFEKELRKRGYDPTDERFGRDIIGEIVEIKMKDAIENGI